MTGKRIFIADDDEMLVKALKARCEQLGLEVATAHDGLTALTSILVCTPDVVLLDLDMPCGSGTSVLDLIANDPAYGDIPVIILTGTQNQATIQRCRELRARYIQKGGDVWQRLQPVIQELLECHVGPQSPVDSRLAESSQLAGSTTRDV
jgi:CheY-like chemotaxis protein